MTLERKVEKGVEIFNGVRFVNCRKGNDNQPIKPVKHPLEEYSRKHLEKSVEPLNRLLRDFWEGKYFLIDSGIPGLKSPISREECAPYFAKFLETFIYPLYSKKQG